MVRRRRVDNTWLVAALTACSEARYRLTIAISLPTAPAFDTPVRGEGSRRNIAMLFGMEKLEWLGYATVKKNWKIPLFVLTEFTNVTDGQTDTSHKQTNTA